jgi:hypothetical protein
MRKGLFHRIDKNTDQLARKGSAKGGYSHFVKPVGLQFSIKGILHKPFSLSFFKGKRPNLGAKA